FLNLHLNTPMLHSFPTRRSSDLNYVASHVIEKKTSSSNIQDAHEAIRPTNIHLTPTVVKESLSRDQFRLYQLIWKRFTASRMARSEEHTSELQSRFDLVCRLLLE